MTVSNGTMLPIIGCFRLIIGLLVIGTFALNPVVVRGAHLSCSFEALFSLWPADSTPKESGDSVGLTLGMGTICCWGVFVRCVVCIAEALSAGTTSRLI